MVKQSLLASYERPSVVCAYVYIPNKFDCYDLKLRYLGRHKFLGRVRQVFSSWGWHLFMVVLASTFENMIPEKNYRVQQER
jgi:hypothetical protein